MSRRSVELVEVRVLFGAYAGLAGELARVRARVQTIEDQLPADARDRGVYSYATKRGVRCPFDA